MVTREYPPFIVGGIATHTYCLVKYLRALGVDCTVLSFGDPSLSTEDIIFVPPSSSIIKLARSRISDDVKIVRDIYKITNYAKKLLRKKKYDVVHVQEPYIGGLIAHPKRKITTFHSTGVGEAKTLLNAMLYNDVQTMKKLIFDFTLGYLMEYASILTSAVIITPSYTVKYQLVRFYKDNPKKIKVIYNGIEIPENLPSKEEARHILNLPKDKVIILAIGRHDPRKRYDLLIEAVARLDRNLREQIYVVICGQGPQTPFLRSLVEKYGLEAVVFFTGWIPREKIWLYYAAADIFVMTSITESAPIALLEAAATGNAIITTKVGDYSMMMRNGVHGIVVEPGNTNALVKAIEELVLDRNLREKLAKNAKEFVSLFSWKRVALRIVNIYKKVLRQSIES